MIISKYSTGITLLRPFHFSITVECIIGIFVPTAKNECCSIFVKSLNLLYLVYFMPSVFGGSEHSQVFVSLALIASIIGTICSSTVLIIIKKIKLWNLQIALILSMTLFELMYNASFFTGMANTGSFELSVASNLCQLLGGATSSIISNIMAAVALYVVYFRRTLNILHNYYIIIILAIIPGVVVDILYFLAVSGTHHRDFASLSVLGIYFYIRLGSICFNFICSLCTAILIDRMRSKDTVKSRSERAITIFSMRMFYYPFVQAIGRSGCTWYEIAYGYNFDVDKGFNFNPEHTSDIQFAAQCLMVLSTPMISVGHLAIFLIMQPDAARCLDSILGVTFFATLCTQSQKEDSQHMSVEEIAVSTLHSNKSLSSLSDMSHSDFPDDRDTSMISARDLGSMMYSREPSVDGTVAGGSISREQWFDVSK